MNAFRIVQVSPLSDALPFMVEEQRSAWYRPWPKWHRLKQRNYGYPKPAFSLARFQTVEEARAFIDNLQLKRSQLQEKKRRDKQYRAELTQFPRVVEQINWGA